jgi:riboflavin biosynthesis pyrimidine reductase
MRQLFPTVGDVDPADAYGRLAALGPGRPWVRLNMIASVDGANVLSEGGPGMAAQLATAGLLDEVCLTVAPLLAAGEARRILDGAALAPLSVLELGHVLEADGYLFLRYRRR